MKRVVSGFSVLELSIVLVVVAMIVSMVVLAGREQVKIESINNTTSELQQIQEAFTRFAKRYGRLPCPARVTLTPENAEFGQEASDCNDATPPDGVSRVLASGSDYIRVGAVPVFDLGLPAELIDDAWGRRYYYAVTEVNIAALDDGTDGVIVVNDNGGNTITGLAAYVVGSHGVSGMGGRLADAPASAVKSCDAAAKDGENCDLDDAVFIDAAYNDGESSGTFFDDQLVWGTRQNVLEQYASVIGQPQATEFDCIAAGYDGPASGVTSAGDCWYSCSSYQETTSYGNVTYSSSPAQANSLDSCSFSCAAMDSGCSGGAVTDESSCVCAYDCVANGYDGPSSGATSPVDCWLSCPKYEEVTSYGNVAYSSTPIEANSLNSCTFDCATMDAGCTGGLVTDEAACTCSGVYDCIANGYDGPSSGAGSVGDCYYICANHQETTSYGEVSYSGSPTSVTDLGDCTFSCPDMDSACTGPLSANVMDEDDCICSTSYDCVANGWDGPSSGATSSADCYYTCADHKEWTPFGYVNYCSSSLFCVPRSHSLDGCKIYCRDIDPGCSDIYTTDGTACTCGIPTDTWCPFYDFYDFANEGAAEDFYWIVRDGPSDADEVINVNYGSSHNNAQGVNGPYYAEANVTHYVEFADAGKDGFSAAMTSWKIHQYSTDTSVGDTLATVTDATASGPFSGCYGTFRFDGFCNVVHNTIPLSCVP